MLCFVLSQTGGTTNNLPYHKNQSNYLRHPHNSTIPPKPNNMQRNTDEEDSLILGPFFNPETVDNILEVKHNECYRDQLLLAPLSELELRPNTTLADEKPKAWKRVGEILSTNTVVTSVRTLASGLYDLDMPWLCAGLQYNQNIKDFTFSGIDLGGATKMNSLAPFLSNSRSLREITLSNCNIGQDSIIILTNALMNRTGDILKKIGLNRNNLGDNLDELVTALSTCTKLQSLWLSSNGIGEEGITSLAPLLMTPKSKLEHLYLSNNLIDDEAIDILVDSLSNNTKLRELALDGNSRITRSGWLSLLKLVCNTSSMIAVKESNHTLSCLWLFGDARNAVVYALGVDDANLLFSSLELNREPFNRSRRVSTSSIIRQKMIWAHATRGDIKFAGSDIPLGIMPIILSWFGDYSNEKTAHLIKYHDPPLSQEEVNTKRLDSFYRIVLERPLELCKNRQPSVDDVPQLTDTLAHTSLG